MVKPGLPEVGGKDLVGLRGLESDLRIGTGGYSGGSRRYSGDGEGTSERLTDTLTVLLRLRALDL